MMENPTVEASSVGWQVLFEVDGVPYLTLFPGPYAEARARQYHGLLAGTIKPEDTQWCKGLPPGWCANQQ